MLADRPLPALIGEGIEALGRDWANDPDVAAVYLFGSRAGAAAGLRSDVDLAVVLRAGFDASERWRKRLDLLGQACTRLRTDAVDLVVLEDAPAVLGHRVLARGRLLCDRQPERRARVAEQIMRRYLDEAFLRKVLDSGLAERIREGRFAR